MHEHEREQPLILGTILTGISLWTFKYLFSRLGCSKIFFSAAERFKIRGTSRQRWSGAILLTKEEKRTTLDVNRPVWRAQESRIMRIARHDPNSIATRSEGNERVGGHDWNLRSNVIGSIQPVDTGVRRLWFYRRINRPRLLLFRYRLSLRRIHIPCRRATRVFPSTAPYDKFIINRLRNCQPRNSTRNSR